MDWRDVGNDFSRGCHSGAMVSRSSHGVRSTVRRANEQSANRIDGLQKIFMKLNDSPDRMISYGKPEAGRYGTIVRPSYLKPCIPLA